MKIKHKPFMLIIYGPTGVGKTELALKIAEQTPAEIINMDVGQFYAPLSIGTAKPNWKESPIPHHLFDIISEPINYTINEYRTIAYKTIQDVLSRGKLPILVGGSGFYLHSLLFPPQAIIEHQDISHLYPLTEKSANLWQKLYAIDPKRANNIDKNDEYRIRRALSIWHTTATLPSSYSQTYLPEMDYVLVFVERDRQELASRINQRVEQMLKTGWIQETEKLMGTDWQPFIEKKNLIGYPEIFYHIATGYDKSNLEHMTELISAQTRQYAKRQFTFWRKLEREIKKETEYTGMAIGCLETVNLTNVEICLYSNELLQRLSLH